MPKLNLTATYRNSGQWVALIPAPSGRSKYIYDTECWLMSLYCQFRYYVQPGMWIKAIDLVLDRLVVQGADLNTVEALSGSAQVCYSN